jgi:murein DD-endopeptidase MepM/ murein hydrolase activator NlpD
VTGTTTVLRRALEIAHRVLPTRLPSLVRQGGPAAALISATLLGILFVGFAAQNAYSVREARLGQTNTALQRELGAMRAKMVVLEGLLDTNRVHAQSVPVAEKSAPLHRLAILPADNSVSSADLDAIVREARTLEGSWRYAAASLANRNDSRKAMPSLLPTDGYVSSRFSRSRWHPILDRARAHLGVDIAAPAGTTVLAAANGRIVRAGYFGEYGLMIEIEHGHGYVSRYAHLRRAGVREGQLVFRGSKIGEVGETGLADGPHLHYEVLLNGQPRNPLNYFVDASAIPD